MADVKKTIADTLVAMAEKDSRIVRLEADLMAATGAGDFPTRFPDRLIQVGIAEQDLLGCAAGMAAMGKIPFAATFSSFVSQRACDQAVNAIGFNQYNVKIIGTYAGLSSEKNGGTHIGLQDLSIYRNIPYFSVFSPGDCNEMAQTLRHAAEIDGPVYISTPRGPMENVLPAEYRFDGKGVTLSEGKDLALVTTGLATREGVAAVGMLRSEGISIRHIHLPGVKPMDREIIVAAARECGVIFTAENHSVQGGLGSAVAEVVCEGSPCRVVRLGLQDRFGVTACLGWLLDEYGISAERIAARIRDYVKVTPKNCFS